MTEFRIVAIAGDGFRVQRRCFWWWNDERVFVGDVAVAPLTSIRRFESQPDALKWIMQDQPNGVEPFIVVRTLIVP